MLNRSGARVFSTSSKSTLDWVGGTLADIVAANPGQDGENAAQGARKVEKAAEEKYGDKAAKIVVQGTKLHTSTKDPNETQQVITLSVETAGGTRLESNHVRADGTTTQVVTRAGGKK
ncbi:unnamed protein product [Zymoseptoria tritici ST99CH_3D1]|nr:unnamed protein product [Zymoseptoria tritici ST99CH_3D1]